MLLPLMQEDAPHKMKFYHYPNWPHDGLPRNTEDFFKLIGNVLESQRMYGGGPTWYTTGESGHVTSSMRCRRISSTASNVSYACSTSFVAVFLSLYYHVQSHHAARLLHANNQGNHTHFTGWVPDIAVQYCKQLQACMKVQGPSEQGFPFSFCQPSITMNWCMCLLASLFPLMCACMQRMHCPPVVLWYTETTAVQKL